jgi:predicted PurR-regulated permease PerM
MTTAPEAELDEPGEGPMPGLPDFRTTAILILTLLAVVYTLYFGREIFIPLAIAVLLNFLLHPVVRFLGRFHLNEPVAAAVVLFVLMAGIGYGVYTLSDPLQEWLKRAPESIAEVQSKIKRVIRPVEQVNRAAAQVETATQPSGGSGQQVVVRGPSLGERISTTTQSLVIHLFEVIVLLYFLLASGDFFMHKMVRVLPDLTDKKKAVSIAREAKSSISAYLGVVTLINVGLGIVVYLAMLLLRMPNALLWGVAAGLLEFIPYVGAATMTVILTVAAIVTFEDLGRALLVPAVYFTIDVLQANFVTPIVLGRRLTLNPVAIFVGILFWGLIWGVAGAFLAVPILATLKIFCDHIERLRPVGEFLGK